MSIRSHGITRAAFLMTGDDGGGLLVRFTMGDDGDRPINFPSFESILSDRARAFPLIYYTLEHLSDDTTGLGSTTCDK